MDSAWKGDAATKASINKGDFVGRTRNMNNPFKEQRILLSQDQALWDSTVSIVMFSGADAGPCPVVGPSFLTNF